MGLINMVTSNPICTYCKHYNIDDPVNYSCKAYPDGIPKEIIHSEHDHTKPFKGDNGIQFEPIEDEDDR